MSDLLFKDAIDYYNKDKENAIKTSTKITNQSIYNILEDFYELELKKITEEQIRYFLEDKLLFAQPSYVNKIRRYFNKVFNQALEKGLIISNPVKSISTFKEPDEMIKEIEYNTPQEWEIWYITALKRLREFPSELPFYILINTMYFMGIRTGEARALLIEDIQGNYLKINKTCTTVKSTINQNGYILTSPKTKNGVRKIEMPAQLIERMDAYLDCLQKNNLYQRKSFLFGIDKPLSLQSIEKKFKNICRLSNIPIFRPYALRHSHASMLINAGALDYAVASRLGHTVSELRSTYFHLFKTSEENCVQIVNSKHPSVNATADAVKGDLCTIRNKTLSTITTKISKNYTDIHYFSFVAVAQPYGRTGFWMVDSLGNIQSSIILKEQLNSLVNLINTST